MLKLKVLSLIGALLFTGFVGYDASQSDAGPLLRLAGKIRQNSLERRADRSARRSERRAGRHANWSGFSDYNRASYGGGYSSYTYSSESYGYGSGSSGSTATYSAKSGGSAGSIGTYQSGGSAGSTGSYVAPTDSTDLIQPPPAGPSNAIESGSQPPPVDNLPSIQPAIEDATQASTPATNLVVATASSAAADQESTPMLGVTLGLNALNLRKGWKVAELGCGKDARWLITLCKRDPSLTGVGIEIDPALAESARRYVAKAGLSDRIQIITGDATKIKVQADAAVGYLFENVLAQLKPQIETYPKFVSFAHQVPGMNPARHIRTSAGDDIFVYEKQPSRQVASSLTSFRSPAEIQVTRPMATWGNHQYSRPVCNSRGCSMCNSIRRQLFR